MDNASLRGKDVEFDIESGDNTSEEDISKDLDSCNRQLKNRFSFTWRGLLNFDRSNKHKSRFESCSNSANSDNALADNVELLVDRNLEGEDVEEHSSIAKNNHSKQSNGKTNPRKPPKPPRPPKGPLLDAADQMFVKEIAELASRKRARIKRMEGVKKMKASKATTSSYITLSAMAFTALFLIIVILQVIKSGSGAAAGLMASPEPAVASDEAFISIQFPKTSAAYEVLQDR
ncbi:hypothetical protein L6164_010322 [Bauhinia variegata]|uniref:Uncharacterized protein n=1 Tax=Bauhinia variegata TaxID=167791 RepID=A0ACB9PP53_BAUVA|nr:hypothetical protein L6164_010322 [Bauhinia variegata]